MLSVTSSESFGLLPSGLPIETLYVFFFAMCATCHAHFMSETTFHTDTKLQAKLRKKSRSTVSVWSFRFPSLCWTHNIALFYEDVAIYVTIWWRHARPQRRFRHNFLCFYATSRFVIQAAFNHLLRFRTRFISSKLRERRQGRRMRSILVAGVPGAVVPCLAALGLPTNLRKVVKSEARINTRDRERGERGTVGVSRDECLSTSERSRLWARQGTRRGRPVLARGVTKAVVNVLLQANTHGGRWQGWRVCTVYRSFCTKRVSLETNTSSRAISRVNMEPLSDVSGTLSSPIIRAWCDVTYAHIILWRIDLLLSSDSVNTDRFWATAR
jgi:hypothetical protein